MLTSNTAPASSLSTQLRSADVSASRGSHGVEDICRGVLGSSVLEGDLAKQRQPTAAEAEGIYEDKMQFPEGVG